MNNSNIYINPEQLENKIIQLKDEKQKIEIVFSEIKNDVNNMINYWSGSSGEEAYNVLVEYTKDFNVIINTLNKKINFIEKALEAYRKMDSLINKKLEENSNIEIL
ncbi:MAG: WXG100 family type VII secretion target [Bacilli bacterium]|nr:WXG100 family type VII secretion target [Bacilli bacterium]